MPIDEAFIASLDVRPISRSLDVSTFNCHPSIDWFLTEKACELHEKRFTTVRCWLADGDLAGYITTSMNVVEIESADRQERGLQGIVVVQGQKFYDKFPALLIGMLGVCERYRGRGLGEHMVKWAVGQALSLGEIAACRFVVVDSDKNDAALRMYAKCGFTARPGQKESRPALSMYFDLRSREIP